MSVAVQRPPIVPIRLPPETLQSYNLFSNSSNVPSDKVKWLEAWPADTPQDQIIRELAVKGVVWVKGVMPKDYVLAARKRWFEFTAPSGVLKFGTDPVDGIFCGEDPADFVGVDNASATGRRIETCKHMALSLEACQSDWAYEFSSNSYLMDYIRKLRPEWTSPFVFRRQLFRTNIPNNTETSTGVHYDHLFLRGGPPTALTAWIPIGDCSPEQGGLMYLEDSMGIGERIEDGYTKLAKETGLRPEEAVSVGNRNMTTGGIISVDVQAFSAEHGGHSWLIGDYEAGDAVFHHSYTIHASGSNRDQRGRIRLSADLRFADRDQPYETRWQKPWVAGDGL